MIVTQIVRTTVFNSDVEPHTAVAEFTSNNLLNIASRLLQAGILSTVLQKDLKEITTNYPKVSLAMSKTTLL